MIGRMDSWLNSANVGVGVPEWAMWGLVALFAATFAVLVWVTVDYFRKPPKPHARTPHRQTNKTKKAK